MNNAQNNSTMTINNWNLTDLCIECINKTAQDKRGCIQIAQGMGLLPNDVAEGWTTDALVKRIAEDIESMGRANWGGMTWTIDPTDSEFYIVEKH